MRENSFLRNKFILCNKEKELPYWIETEDVLAGDKNKGTARKKKKTTLKPLIAMFNLAFTTWVCICFQLQK